MKEPKRYTITSALPYANGPLHIGHLAGAYLSADIYARYLRLAGKEVVYVCGSDEHGAAITIKAKKENTTPKEIIDRYHNLIKETFKKLDISFDIYHRTSEPIHYETSQEFFRILLKNNAFEVIESEQYFDERANQFLADRYIQGTCPKCNNPNAYGDQCEKCGSTLSPTELINPVSTLSNTTPIKKKTKHWFLKLNEFEQDINTWLDTKKDIWKSHVYGQCKSWIKQGLQPRAMTRDLDWGIPVPPEVEGSEGKVLYVWLDAPIGYVSATKQLFKEMGEGKIDFSTPKSDFLKSGKEDDWKKFWQSEDTSLIHFIGKDNIVFHCITFPAILKATEQYILPENVPANEFMNLQGDKISTSRNWAVWAHEYIENYPNKIDELRYTLIANMPEQKDSEFTWEDFQARVNNELVANLGNFIKRVSDLLHKFYDGKIPDFSDDEQLSHLKSEAFQSALEAPYLAIKNTEEHLKAFRFRDALRELMVLSSFGNNFLQSQEPWRLIKTDIVQTQRVMYAAAHICAGITYLSQLFLPYTSKKLQHIFNLEVLNIHNFDSKNHKWLVASGVKINSSEILFEKIDDAFVEVEKGKLGNKEEKMTEEEKIIKPIIQYEDFAKIDIRTGVIIEAQKVPKADKLLQLTVDLGFEQRTILSGIAEFFTPEEVVGKKVAVVANLAPRKLRGIESNGMILMAEDASGKLFFVESGGVAGEKIS
jgi:methionyl-tRNA synthetase